MVFSRLIADVQQRAGEGGPEAEADLGAICFAGVNFPPVSRLGPDRPLTLMPVLPVRAESQQLLCDAGRTPCVASKLQSGLSDSDCL